MKRIITNTFLLVALTIIFGACSKKSVTYIQVLQPAMLTMPDNVQKIAIINRTFPKKGEGTQFLNVLEGILTGEGIMTDRFASEECVNGMTAIMLQSPRFQVVRPPVAKYYGTGTGRFPAPLSWGEIEKICKENGADALIALEAFDSNSNVTYTEGTRTVKNKEGVDVQVPTVTANSRMNVTQGYRLYDVKNKQLFDEFRSEEYRGFTGKGDNPNMALANLPPKMDMLNKTAFQAGQVYGTRITPLWITVGRQFYKKGNYPLELAGRKAAVNDWNSAAQIWAKEVYNKDKKVAARATYNMAVASEVEGKLDLAVEWANKAYTSYNLKLARDYSQTLQYRIEQQKKADMQMRSKTNPVDENNNQSK
ncbi:MAG: DUF6340 family protein [Bacteroidota bacterium]